MLGVLYNQGEGVAQDYVEAYKWLVLAIANGGDDAVELRDLLRKKMTPSQIKKAQTLAKKEGYKIRSQKTSKNNK